MCKQSNGIRMERARIESSDLKSVGYDEPTQTLEIEFRQGGTYQYFGVPKKIHDSLMQYALSHDQYHSRHIKNRYRRTKVR